MGVVHESQRHLMARYDAYFDSNIVKPLPLLLNNEFRKTVTNWDNSNRTNT